MTLIPVYIKKLRYVAHFKRLRKTIISVTKRITPLNILNNKQSLPKRYLKTIQ